MHLHPAACRAVGCAGGGGGQAIEHLDVVEGQRLHRFRLSGHGSSQEAQRPRQLPAAQLCESVDLNLEPLDLEWAELKPTLSDAVPCPALFHTLENFLSDGQHLVSVPCIQYV
jgi:hypothetical protein